MKTAFVNFSHRQLNEDQLKEAKKMASEFIDWSSQCQSYVDDGSKIDKICNSISKDISYFCENYDYVIIHFQVSSPLVMAAFFYNLFEYLGENVKKIKFAFSYFKKVSIQEIAWDGTMKRYTDFKFQKFGFLEPKKQ